MKKNLSYNKTGELSDILNDAMINLKNAIDINTVVGKPIENSDGTIVVPVSKVYCGVIAGGGEMNKGCKELGYGYPFAGGTGAGFTINPIGFLVTKNSESFFVNTETDKTSEKFFELANRMLKVALENIKEK